MGQGSHRACRLLFGLASALRLTRHGQGGDMVPIQRRAEKERCHRVSSPSPLSPRNFSQYFPTESTNALTGQRWREVGGSQGSHRGAYPRSPPLTPPLRLPTEPMRNGSRGKVERGESGESSRAQPPPPPGKPMRNDLSGNVERGGGVVRGVTARAASSSALRRRSRSASA